LNPGRRGGKLATNRLSYGAAMMMMMMMIIIIIIIQFFIIYMSSQQLQGQLKTQHSVVASNYIKERQNIKTTTNYRQALEEENTSIKKSKQTKQR
jgi:uncharacterized membrane protein